MGEHILIVDDDPVQRRLLEAAVERMGYAATAVESGEAALEQLGGPQRDQFRLVVLDLLMPGIDGLQVMEAMRERGLALPVVVQTAQGSIDTVISAMRAGAFDFVVKPVAPDRLRIAVKNALKVGTLRDKAAKTRGADRETVAFKEIVTSSAAMGQVMQLAQKAAASNIPILIEGDSGVGKELVARAIQAASDRGSKPFVTVNCGAIPENLVESILFGHEKGAFTGATEKHTGKFVEAHGGTLFLDEIGDLPLDVQVKLLRAIQEGEVDPVGAKSARKVDIRLVSATHRDLMQKVCDGSFREDLFYRLNVFPIRIPPLCERPEDIPPLVELFAKRFAKDQGLTAVPAIAPEALAMLQSYDWPGNIRQLENALFRAVVLCDGDRLTLDEFPQIRAQVSGAISFAADDMPASAAPEMPAPVAKPVNGEPQAAAQPAYGAVTAVDTRGQVRSLAEIEAEMIRFAITHYKGQMSQVARKLGIGRSTLYRKLKEYGIEQA